MKVWYFSETAYPNLPSQDAYDSIRVTLPNRFYDPSIGADLFDRYLDEWALADAEGLNVMINEHHQTATCVDPAAPVLMGAIARMTKRARLLILGNPIANRRDPIRVAEEMALLDILSHGRLEVGFVRGVPYEIAAANANPVRSSERQWEALDLIVKAWTQHDGPFSHEGRFFQHRNVNIWPRPFQQPHPPIWVSATSASGAAKVGTRGYVNATFLTGFKNTPGVFDAYRRGWRESGRPGDVPLDRLAYSPMLFTAAGGAFKMVSPADTYVYEYDWTPDGRGFVGTAAKGDGDDNWWIAKLEAFGRDGADRVISAPKLQMNFPRVSPDGRTVAFIGGLMSDFGSVGGDVYTVPFAGGEPKDATPGYRGTFTSIVWRGLEIKGTALIGADTAAVSIDPRDDKVEVLAKGPLSFSAGDGRVSWSGDGRVIAASVQGFEHPPTLAVHVLGQPQARPLTHDNDDIKPELSARNVEWTHDGEHVQGWLLSPLHVDAGKTYPMLVEVHGGPAAASVPSFVRGRHGEGPDRPRLLRAAAQPPRLLRPGRGVRAGQQARLRRRRSRRTFSPAWTRPRRSRPSTTSGWGSSAAPTGAS